MLTNATDKDETTRREDAATLRDPDARGSGERRIVYEWEIDNDGQGHRRLAVLTIGFRKAGINYFNYEQHPTEYIASLRNEYEDTTGSLPTRSYSPLATFGLGRETTSRFSKKGLALFAQTAARELKDRYAAGDTTVLPYFNPDPRPPLTQTQKAKE